MRGAQKAHGMHTLALTRILPIALRSDFHSVRVRICLANGRSRHEVEASPRTCTFLAQSLPSRGPSKRCYGVLDILSLRGIQKAHEMHPKAHEKHPKAHEMHRKGKREAHKRHMKGT